MTDVCQYAYCPRTAYFTYVIPLPQPLPSAVGIQNERITKDSLNRLLRSRAVAKHRLEGHRIHWRISMHSERHGLSGLLDLVIELPDRVYPAVIKQAPGPFRPHHRLFLAAYSLLAAETFARPADVAFFQASPSGQTWSVRSQQEDLERLSRTMDSIRRMVATERTPQVTRNRSRCAECEHRRFCGDVL